MTDEQQAESETTPVKRGRPAGAKNRPKKRAIQREPMRQPIHQPIHEPLHRAPITEADLPQLYEHVDELGFPKDVLLSLANDYGNSGYVVQWVNLEVMGMPTPKFYNHRRRQGWIDCPRSAFGGILKPYLPPGEPNAAVIIGGQILMTIDVDRHTKIRRLEKRAADDPRANHERAHRVEGINVPGGSHESALRTNMHRHGYSPYNPDQKIPD